MNEASGTPTPRTDALHAEFPFNAGANYICDHARQIERELQQAQQHAEYEASRANGAIKEMVAMQDELQQARTMHAEAIEEWAKWEGAAKHACGEAHDEILRLLAERANKYANTVEDYYLHGLWMARDLVLSLKPSPASGEQINADAQERQPSDQGSVNSVRLPQAENTPASSAPNAVPDDPVADGPVSWYLAHLPKGADYYADQVDGPTIRALDAHYLRKAPEGYALVPLATLLRWAEHLCRRQEDEAFSIDMIEHEMRSLAAAKQEADR